MCLPCHPVERFQLCVTTCIEKIMLTFDVKLYNDYVLRSEKKTMHIKIMIIFSLQVPCCKSMEMFEKLMIEVSKFSMESLHG